MTTKKVKDKYIIKRTDLDLVTGFDMNKLDSLAEQKRLERLAQLQGLALQSIAEKNQTQALM